MTDGNDAAPAHGIPPKVAAFIREHVASIEILEVLLLFHSTPDRAWTAEGVAAELRLQPRSVEQRCAALVKAGLLSSDTAAGTPAHNGTPAQYRFVAPSSATAVVDDLAATYRTRRVSVIELIFSKPPNAPRAFAEAFVIRRGDRDE